MGFRNNPLSFIPLRYWTIHLTASSSWAKGDMCTLMHHQCYIRIWIGTYIHQHPYDWCVVPLFHAIFTICICMQQLTWRRCVFSISHCSGFNHPIYQVQLDKSQLTICLSETQCPKMLSYVLFWLAWVLFIRAVENGEQIELIRNQGLKIWGAITKVSDKKKELLGTGSHS